MNSTSKKSVHFLEPSPLIHRKICSYNEALSQTKQKHSQAQVSKKEILSSVNKQSLVQMFETIGDKKKMQFPNSRQNASINTCQIESQKKVPYCVQNNNINKINKQKSNFLNECISCELMSDTINKASRDVPKLNAQRDNEEHSLTSSELIKELPSQLEPTKSPSLTQESTNKLNIKQTQLLDSYVTGQSNEIDHNYQRSCLSTNDTLNQNEYFVNNKNVKTPLFFNKINENLKLSNNHIATNKNSIKSEDNQTVSLNTVKTKLVAPSLKSIERNLVTSSLDSVKKKIAPTLDFIKRNHKSSSFDSVKKYIDPALDSVKKKLDIKTSTDSNSLHLDNNKADLNTLYSTEYQVANEVELSPTVNKVEDNYVAHQQGVENTLPDDNDTQKLIDNKNEKECILPSRYSSFDNCERTILNKTVLEENFICDNKSKIINSTQLEKMSDNFIQDLNNNQVKELTCLSEFSSLIYTCNEVGSSCDKIKDQLLVSNTLSNDISKSCSTQLLPKISISKSYVSSSSASSSSSSDSSEGKKGRKISVINKVINSDSFLSPYQQPFCDGSVRKVAKKSNQSLYKSKYDSCQEILRNKRVSVDSAIETSYRPNFVYYNELPNVPYSKLNVLDWQQDIENDYNSSSSSEDSSNNARHRKCSIVDRYLNQSAISNMLNGSSKRKQSIMSSLCLESERADNESGFFEPADSKTVSTSEMHKNFKSLSDLDDSDVFLNRTRNSSFTSSISDETVIENKTSRSNSQEEFDCSSSFKKFMPKRRSGLSGILSLDELSEQKMPLSRKMSKSINESESVFTHKENFYQKSEVSNRRPSTIFMNFNKFQTSGLDVVADKETQDIISDSVETLSTFHSDLYRPVSKYSSLGFDKLKFDEEEKEEGSETDQDSSSKKLFYYNNEKNTNIADHVRILKEVVLEKHENEVLETTCSHVTVVSEPVIKKWDGEEIFFEKNLNPDESKSTTFSTMFGYFNFCLYNFICEEYTKEKWCEIVKKLELTKNQIWMFKKRNNRIFDDEVTDQVLKTASKVLNINFNLFLQKFGDYYFSFSLAKYGDLLKSIATSLCDFINNIDDIRRHIHKIEKIADEYPPSLYAALDKQGTLMMYYHSNRDQRCLDYFLIGFIKTAARVLYGMKTRISLYESRKSYNDYSVISIKAVTSLVNKKNTTLSLQFSTRPSDLFMEPFQMDSIFPFHMILDNNLNICQLGSSLNRLLERFIPTHGLNIKKYFRLLKPLISFSYESMKSNLNTVFILSSVNEISFDGFNNGIILKGQVTTLDTSDCLWFVGSPKVDLVSQLNGESNLYLSDIPIHDATREVLLVNERTNEQDNLKTQLEVLTNRLKETSKELALSKMNTENILDDIFPKDVAESLMRNLPVPAVTKEEVSILFTDIVGFTAICEKSDPADITDMLNNLYIGFDLLCEAYEVYKVETIGDAYMAVAGIHQKDVEHGRCTTAMGISMITRAKKVFAPTGNPVEIRVGIHSGPVVAGVVGTRMPRYCLFGNNVTFANKMESTSESGKLHISPVTYLEIKHYEEFVFFERPREVMPAMMQKKYQGNSYFVTQRRVSQFQPLPNGHGEKRRSFMMPIRRPSEVSFVNESEELDSRCPSPTESVLSDHDIFPEELRKQLVALELINGYQNGKYFKLPKIGAA
ncbi:uncharacterized protein LOC100197914 isoform X2 [Hydra vulgaris]|uniref:guanylate cyclase n=1 Tax=Hydra vulgaris TaxID=6087 RepID=A0ABM4D5T8_HYDVU